MKKIILTTIAAVMLFGSCKKDKTEYSVKVTFSAYNISIGGEVINYWTDKKTHKQFITKAGNGGINGSGQGSASIDISLKTGDKFYYRVQATDPQTRVSVYMTTPTYKNFSKSDIGDVVFEDVWE